MIVTEQIYPKNIYWNNNALKKITLKIEELGIM